MNILIVEDDPMVAHIHKHYISELQGYSILGVFNNGLDALKYILKNYNEIDLIILDVYMPKMDGLELLKKIRENNINVSVIPVTAVNDNKTISQFLNLGVIDYLVKPFTQERFNQAVYRCELKYKTFSNQKLNQSDIDQLFSSKKDGDLPKGIQQKTLNYIVSKLATYKNQEIDVDEISEITNLSKVSLRKYLDYLMESGIIEKDIDYGTVGRPKYKYFIK
jgi:response regulator of citrate/malate metabolism